MSEKEMTGNLFFFAKRETNLAAEPAKENARLEARLIERVSLGDQAAFDELYRMFAPMVHGIALARAPRDEADDIVQDVFISAYKNLSSLRDRNRFGAWLATIARNRAREFYRQHKPTEELSEEISRHDNSHTEAREILETIRTLPETYRETLILRLVEGMSGVEIAEQTGLAPESVRVNLHRGMKLLRERLGIGRNIK